MSIIGTTVRGLRAPIIREGDNLANIVVNTVLNATREGNFQLKDRDVIGITESVVARAQGNYTSVDNISFDVRRKFGKGTVGVLFPILSRNRFATCLKGIVKGLDEVVLMLSYPTDEVGNAVMDKDKIIENRINPFETTLKINAYYEIFGKYKHPFTEIDYVDYYHNLIEDYGSENNTIIFSNKPEHILKYTKKCLVCNIHNSDLIKNTLINNGAELVLTLKDIMNEPGWGTGYNEEYGLLGSNKVDENHIKLFPRDGQILVDSIQKELEKRTGVRLEVMIYGDGAFCDPVGKIWELADPVVSPAYTSGLKGTPNELKLKYLADNQFAGLRGENLQEAISTAIKEKDDNLVGKMDSQGTTPRRYTDLLGSLCDLTSGSGDKGTPIVLIQNYFENYAS